MLENCDVVFHDLSKSVIDTRQQAAQRESSPIFLGQDQLKVVSPDKSPWSSSLAPIVIVTLGCQGWYRLSLAYRLAGGLVAAVPTGDNNHFESIHRRGHCF